MLRYTYRASPKLAILLVEHTGIEPVGDGLKSPPVRQYIPHICVTAPISVEPVRGCSYLHTQLQNKKRLIKLHADPLSLSEVV